MAFFNSVYQNKEVAEDPKASSSAVQKFWRSGTGMNLAKACKNIIFRKFSTNRKILKLFQKKSSGGTRSSHQLVIDRTLKHFLTQLIIPKNFAEETKSLSSVALKFCEVVPGWNGPKHPETWFFWVFSTNHEILRLFQKKNVFGVSSWSPGPSKTCNS